MVRENGQLWYSINSCNSVEVYLKFGYYSFHWYVEANLKYKMLFHLSWRIGNRFTIEAKPIFLFEKWESLSHQNESVSNIGISDVVRNWPVQEFDLVKQVSIVTILNVKANLL